MTREEKMRFVKRCFDDVVNDICETQYGDNFDDPIPSNTAQIIADYKAENAEYGYMTEDEFDELYSKCEYDSTMRAMAWC